jgi:hypothetical protein
MKKATTIPIMTLFIMAGCGGGSKQATGDLITVDVTANYPKKELILQDFMDVEYIPLETNDAFICQGLVLDISKTKIIVRNHPGDGNVFIFDRNGKALKKINRKGQGAEEYTVYMKIAFDEDKAELFVNDRPRNRIVVYDLEGNFKRNLKQDDKINFTYICNFDRENLIGYNSGNDIEDMLSFIVISKQDGSVTKEIQTPFSEKINMEVEFEMNNATYYTAPSTYNPILPYAGNWIFTDQSSDTVYRYQPDHTISPVIARTLPVQSMNPVVFLFPSLFTGRYYFMDAVKKEVDTSKEEWFPTTNLLYDKQENALFRYTVYNADYIDNRPVKIDTSVPVVNEEIASWINLEAPQLIEDYGKGKLTGKLKEIAAGLDEESNPVIMLIKHKKRNKAI